MLIDINFLYGLCHNPILHALPQDGWTSVLLASGFGHQSLVQELCESFGADFLHRKKVRVMLTVSGSEWFSELCMCGCTHRMTVSQPWCLLRWQSVLVVMLCVYIGVTAVEHFLFPFVCCSATVTGLSVHTMT